MLSFTIMSSAYHKNIAEGRCGQCGKINDRTGKSTCSECAKKDVINQTETRNWYRNHGYCPRCKKNKLMGQEKTCVECRAKDAESKARERERETQEDKDKRNEYARIRYKVKQSAGVCPRCGRKMTKNTSACESCLEKNRTGTPVSENGKDRVKMGLCYWCGVPVKPGYKVCEKHYQMNCEKAKKTNREKMSKSNNRLFIK